MDFMERDERAARETVISRAESLAACRRAMEGARAPLSDLSLLPLLRREFDRECRVGDAAVRRRMFTFVFALLYAPGALAGRRLPQGMRRALSSAVPEVAACRLSRYLPQAAWEYGHYRAFREEATRLACRLWARATAGT